MDRRTFLFASSGAAAGSLVVPGFAEAHDDDAKSPIADSGLATGKLKPLRHKEVPGFLSAAQIAPHHTAHYGGALKAFAAADAKFEESFTKGTAIDPAAFERLKQIQSSRGNSVILHELYFDGLSLQATAPPEGTHLHVFLEEVERQQALLMHAGFLKELQWGGKVVGVRVDLLRANRTVITELLRQAWLSKAPRSLASKLEAAEHTEP